MCIEQTQFGIRVRSFCQNLNSFFSISIILLWNESNAEKVLKIFTTSEPSFNSFGQDWIHLFLLCMCSATPVWYKGIVLSPRIWICSFWSLLWNKCNIEKVLICFVQTWFHLLCFEVGCIPLDLYSFLFVCAGATKSIFIWVGWWSKLCKIFVWSKSAFLIFDIRSDSSLLVSNRFSFCGSF